MMISNGVTATPTNSTDIPYSLPTQSPADALMNRNMWGVQFANQMNGTNTPGIQSGKNGQGQMAGGMGNLFGNVDPSNFQDMYQQLGQQQVGKFPVNNTPVGMSNKGPQNVSSFSPQDNTPFFTGREDQVNGTPAQVMGAMQAPGASWMASPGSERGHGNSKNPQTQGGNGFPTPGQKPPSGQNNPLTGPGAPQQNNNNNQNWNTPLNFGGWTAGQNNIPSGNGMPGPMGNGWNNVPLNPTVYGPQTSIGYGNIPNIQQNAGMHMQNYGGGKNPAGMLVDTLGRMGSGTIGGALAGPIGSIAAGQAYRRFVPQLGGRPGFWQNEPNGGGP